MSMKKSIFFLIAVIVAVTLFSFLTSGGNAMLIDMSDTAISFSGIGDFSESIAYSDIVSAELVDAGDTELLGYKEELYKAGFGSDAVHTDGTIADFWTYSYFVTTQTDSLIVLTLTDNTLMLFNYNNTSDTQAIYNMLLENIQ